MGFLYSRYGAATGAGRLVALLRRGDRSWPDLTDQIETVGSAREVLDSALVISGQAALFDTGSAVDLEGVAAEIAAWEREGMRYRLRKHGQPQPRRTGTTADPRRIRLSALDAGIRQGAFEYVAELRAGGDAQLGEDPVEVGADRAR